jgi:hypothetical protein
VFSALQISATLAPDLAVQNVVLRLDYFHYYHHRRYHGGGGVSGKEIALMQGVQIAEGEM